MLVVGTATLATPVGETTLGNYIFQGLETRNHLSTVFGCLFAALLAVVLDQLIRLLEKAARILFGFTAAMIFLLGCRYLNVMIRKLRQS